MSFGPGPGSLDESRRLQDAALANLGLYRYKVPEDGNCMFRAVASQLNLNQDKYQVVLREAAATWIQQHMGDLLAAGLLESVQELQDTATEGKWCGQAALVALANVLRVNIAVVQGGDQGSIDIQHVAPFDNTTVKEHPGILLAYLYNGHYDGVVHEPNVSNPDYAVWSAKCHYNDAVSEKVAYKLSSGDDLRTPPALRHMFKSRGRESSGELSDSSAAKVSSVKINLQPVKNSTGLESPTKVKTLRNYNEHRRPSVDNIIEPSIPQSPRHTVFRPSKSEVHASSTRRAQSESPDIRQRRASSPGPQRQSPYTSIRAAVEKHRRRSSSREAPIDLPYNYDGSIRLFGAAQKPGSLTESRESSPMKQHGKANLRKTVSTGNESYKVQRSPTPVKNFGVELKNTGRKITRQNEQEEEYAAPRHLPPKQMSLKDFGREVEQSRQEVRRSSEGATQKKSKVPAAYQTSKPAFGVDFGSKKGKSSAEQKSKASKVENGFHLSERRESNDSASKVPPKVPPKVHPKPKTQGESKKMTIIPIRLSSNTNTADKEQQLPDQSVAVQNGYDTGHRSPRIRSVSQKEMSKASHQQSLNRASSSPSERPLTVDNTRSRKQLSLEATDRQIRMRNNQQETRTRSRESQQEPRIRSRDNQQEPRTRTRSRQNGTTDPPPQQRTRARNRDHKENFEGYHKERVRSRERRQSADSQSRKIASAAHDSHTAARDPDKLYIDTADIVTTPTEPLASKKKQHMPYVGLSPSESRKVNVQVSTEDYEESCQTEPDPIVLLSPQMVRDASTGSCSYVSKSGISSLTSIPLSPVSPSPYHESPASSGPPHLSPGPYSPGPSQTSVPSSPSPGISRVIQLSHSSSKDILEIPLRGSLEQPTSPRRRSVVEIQPQPLQTPQAPSTSTGRGVATVPTIHLKSSVSDKGKSNGTDKGKHSSKARMFFS